LPLCSKEELIVLVRRGDVDCCGTVRRDIEESRGVESDDGVVTGTRCVYMLTIDTGEYTGNFSEPDNA